MLLRDEKLLAARILRETLTFMAATLRILGDVTVNRAERRLTFPQPRTSWKLTVTITAKTLDEILRAEKPVALPPVSIETGGTYYIATEKRHLTRAGEIFVFKGKAIHVLSRGELNAKELKLEIAAAVFKHQQRYRELSRQVQAFSNLADVDTARREVIPERIRLFVWQRDEGKCVVCGSNEKLEFDHIIPIARGGATSQRNVQLLCEACNRKKGASV